ncbi:MAG: hypothetical protein WDW38_005187 [Sanguina aurantia]
MAAGWGWGSTRGGVERRPRRTLPEPRVAAAAAAAAGGGRAACLRCCRGALAAGSAAGGTWGVVGGVRWRCDGRWREG